MFFIMGVEPKQKQLSYNELFVCNQCGKYGRYEVFLTFMCFSLFFIPLIKWNKRYYVRTSCCGEVYELDPAIGGAIARGKQVEIQPEHLKKVRGYGNVQSQGAVKKCPDCGYETAEDFQFCPKCGRQL